MSVLRLISDVANMVSAGYWVAKDRRSIREGREGRIEAEIARSNDHIEAMFPPPRQPTQADLPDEKETR